jgi:DNA repair and recombination protein RAD52
VDLGQAHESAIKEAETDAMKRALMTFGNPFGLALYDKEQANVCDPEDEMVARFKAAAVQKISEFTDAKLLSDWWNSEAQKIARRNVGLTQDDADALKAKVVERLADVRKVAA